MDQTISKLIKKYKTNDPFAIATSMNILIRFADLPEGTRGFYYRILRRRFIVLSNDLTDEWSRFVCAHELGHDRLHPGLNSFWLDAHSFTNPGKYERQANTFAIKLLTAGDSPQQEESIEEYFSRLNIPKTLTSLYIPSN